MSEAEALFPDPLPEHPPPRRRGLPAWGIVLIVAGVLLVPIGGLGVLVAIGFAFGASAQEIEPTAGDRKALLTVEAFARDWEHDAQPELAAVTKLRYPDGTLGIEYEYEDEAFYLYSSIDVERSARDARSTYGGATLFNRLGVALEDEVRMRTRDDLFRWGDQSQFCVMLFEGEESGYTFVGRRGTHVLYVAWSGLVFEPDDGEGIAAFLEPELERMARHELVPEE